MSLTPPFDPQKAIFFGREREDPTPTRPSAPTPAELHERRTVALENLALVGEQIVQELRNIEANTRNR